MCIYALANGIVERELRHLLDVARALKFYSNVPDFFGGQCILTDTFLINKIPSPILNNKTPFEILFHESASISI